MHYEPPLLPGQAYPGGPMIGEIYAAMEAEKKRAAGVPAGLSVSAPPDASQNPEHRLLLLDP